MHSDSQADVREKAADEPVLLSGVCSAASMAGWSRS
jgi:hypothetical protein